MAHVLFKPAHRILYRIPISLKFGIIALVFLVAAAVPTVLLIRSQNANIAVANREEGGVLFFKPLFMLARDLTMHRLAMPEGPSGDDTEQQQARRVLEAAIKEDLEGLARVPAAIQASLGTREDVEHLQALWASLLKENDPGRQALAHEAFLKDIYSLESKVVDSSLLIGDPEVVGSYVEDVAAGELPLQEDQTLRLTLQERAGPAPGQAADGSWRALVDRQSGSIQGILDSIKDDLSATKAFADPGVRRRLEDLLRSHQDATERLLRLAGPPAQGQAAPVSASALAFAGRKVLESSFLFQDTALRVLEGIVQRRIRQYLLDQRLALAATLAATLLAFYLLGALHASLRSGFLAVGASLAALAGGDLTCRTRVVSEDELGTLARHLNQALDNVEGLVTQIQISAWSIHEASRDIAQESERLARRTESQAAGLEQTVAGIVSLSETLTQSGAEARLVRQDTGRVDELIKACREYVGQATAAIQEISRASRQVEGVNGLVEDVAFHANLAAVDAVVSASAGDREKGFTALASEVHQLGRRSAEASRQIRGLLEETLAAIRRGAASGAQAEGAVEGITRDLREMTAAVGAITEAAEEQSAGLAQISQAMEELGAVTLRNAAMASQTKDAAESLNIHAQLLIGLTSSFKVQPPPAPE